MSRLCLSLAGSVVLGSLAFPGPEPTRPQDAQPRAHPRPVYKSPLGLAVDHTGQRACVALQTAGAVAIVDLAAGKVLGEVAVGQGPCDLVLVEDELFVACEQSDTVVRVNL